MASTKTEPASTAPFTENWIEGPKSTKFYTRSYAPPSEQPPRALLVFVHGFAEHIGRYVHFHPRLAERGIAVFAFDQRGFGRTALDKNKSPGSAYGKTCYPDQMTDIQWAIEHARKEFPDLPVFLMGHSMGGAEVLGFPTLKKEFALSNLRGIIATSPLIHHAAPPSKLVRGIANTMSKLAPNLLVPTGLVPEYLAHDPKCGEDYANDPLVKTSGSLRGIGSMLDNGEVLLHTHYKDWPDALPVFMAHGTDDKITSCDATKEFHEKLGAKDKHLKCYEGGYHELHNESQEVQDGLKDEILAFIDGQLSQKPKL